MTRKHYNDGFEGPPLEAGITWWPSEGQSVEAGADEVTKVTPAMQTAWCAFEPAGQFSEGMSFARFNGMLRHAFLSGYAAASVDTRPEGGDALAAPFTSGAIGEAETPENTLSTCNSTTIGERQAIAEALREALKDPAIAIGFQWSSPSEKLLDHSLDFLASHVRDAILSLDSPSLGEGLRDWSFLPKQIGRLELGDRPSDNECYCERSHVIPDGAPLYWPQGMGQYDDSNAYCLAHAIELAESDSSWCQTCIAADLAAEAHTPTTNAPVADLREAIAQTVAEHGATQPWWWSAAFDDGTDETAARLRASDLETADAILSLTKNVATNADMRGALKPFAEACNISNASDESNIDDTLAATKITWGDLRRARTVLQGDQP